MRSTPAHIICCLWLLGNLSACAVTPICFPSTPTTELELRAHEIGREAEGDQVAGMLDLAESKLKTNPDEALRLTRALGAGLHLNGIALDIEKSAFLLEKAVIVATDASTEIETRIVAIEVLGYTTWSHHAEDLLQLLTEHEPVKIQQAAIDALELLDAGEFVMSIIARWPDMSPQARDHAATVFIAHSERARALLEAIRDGQIKPSDLSPSNVRLLQMSVTPDVRILAKQLLPPS